jgi:hypothetical protein
MAHNKVDLAGSVLDSLVLSGTVKQWRRHLVVSGGRSRPSVADIYDVQIGADMSEGDQAALRDLLERHGRTALTHQVEIRFRRAL